MAGLTALALSCGDSETQLPTIRTAPTVETAPTIAEAPTTQPAPTFKSAPAIEKAPTIAVAPTVKPAPTFKAAPTIQTAPTAKRADVFAPTPTPEAPASSSDTATSTRPPREFEIITLLAPDAIPAINNPTFFDTTEEADTVYRETELVLGIEIDGDARAYSVPLLSRHEIVNDVVAGNPVAVTW